MTYNENHNTASRTSPELYVLVGLPGSGKDYWIERFLAQNPDKHYHIVSSDAIIEKLCEAVGKTYSEGFDEFVKQATVQMNREVSEAIKLRQNIIWNQTNMAPGKRKKILSQVPRHYRKKAVVVTVDKDIHDARLLHRRLTTGKNIPEFVMKNMRESYIEPSRDEGFDEIIHYSAN